MRLKTWDFPAAVPRPERESAHCCCIATRAHRMCSEQDRFTTRTGLGGITGRIRDHLMPELHRRLCRRTKHSRLAPA